MNFSGLSSFFPRASQSMRSDDGRGEPSSDDKSNESPISDDAYDRIPDKFKRPVEQSDEPKRGGGGDGDPPSPQNSQEPSRRPSFALVIFLIAIVATLTLGYRSIFSPKSTEITWTAFNRLLDAGKLDTAELKGGTLSGTFRETPPLVEWPFLIPDGKKLFQTAVAQYDRSHPNAVKELEAEFEAASERVELRVTRPTVPSSDAQIRVAMVDKETKNVFMETATSSSVSEEELTAIKRELAEDFRLRKQIEQRWELKEVNSGRLNTTRRSLEMVDRKTGKRFGKVFYNNYVCESPAFAYADGTLDARLRDKLDSYTSTPKADNSVWFTVISFAVTILFFIFIFRMVRNTRDQMMGGGGFSAMRSLAKKYDPDAGKRATFDDVAGMDQVKAELVEVVDFLKNPTKYERMGARVPRGTLLFGPPGTGKTLLARAVAGEAGVPFYSINGSEFIQLFVGVGASRVRDIFSTARENAPSILFIDEIDAVGRQRGAGVGGGQDEREQTLNQILSEMDGFTQTDSVMVMASTNRPDVLDPALMRPGRFDRHITVGRPSMRGRVDIFNVYLKKIPCGADVDVNKLAAQTAGFTGADIRNYVNEATLWATRNDKNSVDSADFDFAFEKIALGLKRDEIVKPEDKRKTAVHEAGHTVVGWFMPAGSKVHKVTIIPRGQALGVTWSLPEEDKLSYDASEAKATLAHLLAGRVAEKLVYGVTTSGVVNDLQRATNLARDMVARWGMSERLGPLSFPNSETHPFLGREMSTGERVYSEATAELIDAEIKRVIMEADQVAEKVITERRDVFDKLVDALTVEEELDRKRLEEILGAGPNDRPLSSELTEPSQDSSETAAEDAVPATPNASDETRINTSISTERSPFSTTDYQIQPPTDTNLDDFFKDEDPDDSERK